MAAIPGGWGAAHTVPSRAGRRPGTGPGVGNVVAGRASTRWRPHAIATVTTIIAPRITSRSPEFQPWIDAESERNVAMTAPGIATSGATIPLPRTTPATATAVKPSTSR